MGVTAVLSLISAFFLVVQAISLSLAIAQSFLDGWDWDRSSRLIYIAGVAWTARTLTNSLSEYASRRFGLLAVAEARRLAITRILGIPTHRISISTGALTSLLTRGVDGLETYVARYLPQLVIAVVVPLGIGGVILWLDPLSALIILLTVPLIPLFMALVGWFTSKNVERHWQRVVALSSTLTDLMSGLPELKIFGRARAQAEQIKKLGDEQQTATMKVLRLSFLSAFVLELLSTISVALIAVAVGLRLVNGEMDLWRGLAALVLAPEVYAPLRMLGVHFHAAADGLEAWSRVTVVLDTEQEIEGSVTTSGTSLGVKWQGLSVEVEDQTIAIPDGDVKPGQLVAIVGPSGCGKSTLLNSLLGIREISAGNIEWSDAIQHFAIRTANMRALHSHIGYVSQNAWLGEGSVREVLTRGLTGSYTDADLRSVLEKLNLDFSLDVPISDRSQGVSVGQRRRLAVARALLRKPAMLLLDEPAAALDSDTEIALTKAIREFAAAGGAVIVVAHRPGFREIANVVVDFELQQP